MFPLNLYARVRFFAQLCTRDRGCSAHPAFPAPSFGEMAQANLGQIVPREGEVVSMQHTPRRPGPYAQLRIRSRDPYAAAHR